MEALPWASSTCCALRSRRIMSQRSETLPKKVSFESASMAAINCRNPSRAAGAGSAPAAAISASGLVLGNSALGTTASAIPKAERSARCCQDMLTRFAFDQFDLVAVRIFNEGDDSGAELHRARLARDFHAGFAQGFAGGVDVGHAKCQMAEEGAHLVAVHAPVIGELEHGMVRFGAVTDEHERVFAVRHFGAAEFFHPEQVGIERNALFKVADAQHRMKEGKLAHFFVSPLRFNAEEEDPRGVGSLYH